MRRFIHPFLAMSVLVASGCYTYVPLDLDQARPEGRVKVQVTEGEASRLLTFVDPRARTVTGSIVEVGRDSLTMVVEAPVAFQQVAIPRRAIEEVQGHAFNTRKSLVFAGAMVGIATYVGLKGVHGGGSVPPGDGGGTAEALIPVFSFSFPF